jgi:hypothetical protein
MPRTTFWTVLLSFVQGVAIFVRGTFGARTFPALQRGVLALLVAGAEAEQIDLQVRDGIFQRRLVVGELLQPTDAARGDDDRDRIIGADLAVQEAVQRGAHARHVVEAEIQIVDDDRHDASGLIAPELRAAGQGDGRSRCWCGGFAAGGRRGRGRGTGLARMHANGHVAEVGDGLWLAVLQQLEVAGLQVLHMLAAAVRDDGVDLHRGDADVQRRCLYLFLRLLLRSR